MLSYIDQMINRYWVALIFLAAGIAVFFVAGDSGIRYVNIYFLMLLGLYFSFENPYVIILYSFTALALVYTFTDWNILTALLTVFVIVSVVIPFYFTRLSAIETDIFENVYGPKTRFLAGLERNVSVLKEEKHVFENEIEKIYKLYVLGRELVEHLDINEVGEHLLRILQSRSGVVSISIFTREKNVWRTLAISDMNEKAGWEAFIKENIYLQNESEPRVLPSPEWLKDHSLVFWPIKMEKEFLAAVFLVTESSAESKMIEEGSIFIPQIALGLMRTKLYTEVRERSRNDGLTGLFRREYLLERLNSEEKRAERYKSLFSIMMVDLDQFKKVNDTYGHLVGDKVLQRVSQILSSSVRPGDLVGRYGGEEFLILVYMAKPEESIEAAERLRTLIAEQVFSVDEDKTFKITVSIGISHFPQNGTTIPELISTADQALYWVKQNGRNSVKEFKSILKTV